MADAQTQHKQACMRCASRKVKCDKLDPCSHCKKSSLPCTYNAIALPRPRKRTADEDLVSRLLQYEDLMRKHNVDFTPYAYTWVVSPKTEGHTVKRDMSSDSTLLSPTQHLEIHALVPKQSDTSTDSPKVRCLWSSLAPEMKYPTVQRIHPIHEPSSLPSVSLYQLVYNSHCPVQDLHPQPRNIYRLWQIFLTKVNPLLKIIHATSLGPRVLDASWDPASAPKSLVAMLFAAYTLAIASLTRAECEADFGESKEVLLLRYRAASFRALLDAEFLTTRDLEVFQALVLFLFADPEAEMTSVLVGTAIRIGERMGLDGEKAELKLSVFENEMRIRTWWQLNGLDARVRSSKGPGARLAESQNILGNNRPPLNVNDADLHPDMKDLPLEHKGPTEMSIVLLKFEIYNWYTSSSKARKVMESVIQGLSNGTTVELAERALEEIEAIYEDKYLKYLDDSIPLHRLTRAMAQVSVARLRFKTHHPGKHKTSPGEDGARVLPRNSDLAFESAVSWLESVDVGIKSGFSTQIFSHFTTMRSAGAYVYMISELRCRTSGRQVDIAWRLVEELYKDCPQLMADTDSKFLIGLGELTLEAWDAREKGLRRTDGSQAEHALTTPLCVQMLLSSRRHDDFQGMGLLDQTSFEVFDFPFDLALDWDY